MPDHCEIDQRSVPCPTHRLGDETSATSTPLFLDDDASMGDHVDRSRYTIPYRINTEYWRESGGAVQDATSAQLTAVSPRIATQNEYVKTWHCRGHFFAGGTKPQESDRARRYGASCSR